MLSYPKIITHAMQSDCTSRAVARTAIDCGDGFDITIRWTAHVDLDLCVFYRTNDGRCGGVFSDEFRQSSSDLGSLTRFPFMLHHGDEKEPMPGSVGSECVSVKNLDGIERLDVVIINYDDAVDLLECDYLDEAGSTVLHRGEERLLEVPSTPAGHGQAYHVVSLQRQADGSMAATQVNCTVTLREAFDNIPGFALICED